MKAIRVKFYGPTNRGPAKWIARDGDGNQAKVTQGERDVAQAAIETWAGLPGQISGEELAAYKLCRKMGWTGKLHGDALGPCEYVYVFENVDPLEVK